jgi:predicted AAA+ superfamily ATPase
MRRIYNSILDEHIKQERQMFFLSGPRQVGKTTTAKTAVTDGNYFTWDNQNDRMVISAGPEAVANRLQLSVLSEKPKVVVFDELHKYSKWKLITLKETVSKKALRSKSLPQHFYPSSSNPVP